MDPINGTSREERFDQEILFHLDKVTQDNVALGMSPKEARRQALIQFGGADQVKQQLREVYRYAFFDGVRANLRSAFRFVRRSPSFALAVILILALGIGANSTVYSAIDAILLRPLPFPHGDELVRIHQINDKEKNPESLVSTSRIEDWNRLNSTFQAVTGYYAGDTTFRSGSFPEKISVAFVAPRFLNVWGIDPALGRGFTGAEHTFAGPSAVLVTDRFWRVHLNADAGAVGKPIHLGDSSYTVVGVMPASFSFPEREVDIFEPNPVDAPYTQDRSSSWFTVIGRLKPGVSLARAQADMGAVQARLGQQFSKSDADLRVELQPLKSVILGNVQGSLWLLYGSVSLLLLIACTNIAALLMARTAGREHEIAIRYALGASRTTIVTQLLTEVFVLALLGSLAGLAIAGVATHFFAALAKDLPRVDEVALNGRVMSYSLACALATTFACGLIPALRGTRRNLSGSLAEGGRTQVSTGAPVLWLLVGVQVSLAVALLIGSGLLLRSFQALGRVDPGFGPEHVLTLHVSGSWGETANMGKLTQRINRTLEGLRNVPGVVAAATSASIPGNSPGSATGLKLAENSQNANQSVTADLRFVYSGYFATVGIPLLEGEACRDGLPFDTVLVNRSFATLYFPGAALIGDHLGPAVANDFMRPAQIRGIVGDAREQGLDTAPQPTVYWCSSAPGPDPNFLVRTQGDPAAMANILRRRIQELDPGRSVFHVEPLVDQLSERAVENRLRTFVLTLFAFTAIALVAIGLYGTVNYLSRNRRRETGLRLAFGALPYEIVSSFLLQGVRVALAGIAAGLLLGAALSRLLTGMLYGITPLDTTTYVAVVSLTLVLAAGAALPPALRAARVSPGQVLREQ